MSIYQKSRGQGDELKHTTGIKPVKSTLGKHRTDSWFLKKKKGGGNKDREGQSPWKTVWQFLIKLNIFSLYDPAIVLFGIYPKVVENLFSHKSLLLDVYSGFIHNYQNLEAAKPSFSR